MPNFCTHSKPNMKSDEDGQKNAVSISVPIFVEPPNYCRTTKQSVRYYDSDPIRTSIGVVTGLFHSVHVLRHPSYDFPNTLKTRHQLDYPKLKCYMIQKSNRSRCKRFYSFSENSISTKGDIYQIAEEFLLNREVGVKNLWKKPKVFSIEWCS